MSAAAAHRFYTDEDVPPSAAKIARGMGMDVIAAGEAGALGRADAEQLTIAAADGRMLVTYNRDDFLDLSRDFFAAGKPHAGVLVVVPSVRRVGHVIAHALQSWCANKPPLQPYEVQFLSAWKAE